ncbi:hypothetical protein DFH09DRAFT_1333529 [Mycena vulgaris]|nr:hypothetical protein DFH09DRAFT_1455511 [Mycena vulgaris]KAJ6511866.1 hypothetical protein DFH09DRAFT_1333529 [Mycena vulgaris]
MSTPSRYGLARIRALQRSEKTEKTENPEHSAAARAPPPSSAPWSSTTSGMCHMPTHSIDYLRLALHIRCVLLNLSITPHHSPSSSAIASLLPLVPSIAPSLPYPDLLPSITHLFPHCVLHYPHITCVLLILLPRSVPSPSSTFLPSCLEPHLPSTLHLRYSPSHRAASGCLCPFPSFIHSHIIRMLHPSPTLPTSLPIGPHTSTPYSRRSPSRFFDPLLISPLKHCVCNRI